MIYYIKTSDQGGQTVTNEEPKVQKGAKSQGETGCRQPKAAYNNKLVASKLRRWEVYLKHYHLPAWESIPDLGLYMEQVILLLKQYLDYLPPVLKEEQSITAATINNYVRMNIMPEPLKKRYYRVHLAYLLMILTLKQSLSMALIHRLIPEDLAEPELERIYGIYADRHRMAAEYFTEQVRLAAAPLLEQQVCSSALTADSAEGLIVMSAIIGGFSRLLAEKLILLEGKDAETEPDMHADSSAGSQAPADDSSEQHDAAGAE